MSKQNSKTSKVSRETSPAPRSANKIVWQDGVPRAVVDHPRFDKGNSAQLLTELSKEFLNFPYDGEDPKYFGMTKGEAMIAQLVDAASGGNADARKELMDRVMGRPMQNIKSMSLKGTLSDFLDTLDVSGAEDTDVMDI